jgi:hypothetical protein
MSYIWSRVMGRCPGCGQRLNGHRTADEKILEINNRASRLTKMLGRTPQAQNCSICGRLVFEEERGFIQRYLLIDILDWPMTRNIPVQNHQMQEHV